MPDRRSAIRRDTSERILIVGAGPTGLTAALELARRGFNPRIVDAHPDPSTENRAVGLNSRSLEILEASGVTERLLAAGRRISRIDFWTTERLAASIDLTRLRHRHNYMLMLSQDATESILAQRLLQFGVTVERPVVARSVVDLGAAVSVVLDEGFRKTVEPFSTVIGADGTNSMIRHAAGIGFDGYEYENYWGVAEYVIANWPYDADSLSIFLNARGEFGIAASVGPDRYRFVANTPKTRFQMPGNFNVRRTLSEASFSVRVGQAGRYQAHNRIFLAGDAAHVHAPIGGRGMNPGIEDAAVLAQLIEEDRQDRYTALRRPIAAAAIRRSDRLMRLAAETNRIEIALRNTFLPLVFGLPTMQRRFVARIAGLR